MKKKAIFVTASLFMVGLFLQGSIMNAVAASDQPLKWRLQSSFPTSSLAHTSLLENFLSDVKKQSQGRLEITPFPPEALAKVMETYDAVAKGAIEMAYSAGNYHARKIPEGGVELGLPFSFKDFGQAYEFWFDYKGGEAFNILREAYQKRGTFLLGMGLSGQYAFLTKFKVNTLDDFKGKKMRTTGPYSVMSEKLGASPVSIPSAEIYLALQRGTVDGTVYPVYAMETYKFKEVCEYIMLPYVLAGPMLDIYVNLDAWRSLPEDLKKVMEASLRKNFPIFSKASVDLDSEVMENCKKSGVLVTTLSQGDSNKLRDIAKVTWDMAAKDSDGCARLVDMLKTFLKEKGQ